MVIRHAYTGWPGCTHDARVLRNSSLFEDGEQGNAVGQGNFIIADSAHPLLPQKLAKSAIWETQDNTGLTGDCRVLYKLMKDAMVI